MNHRARTSLMLVFFFSAFFFAASPANSETSPGATSKSKAQELRERENLANLLNLSQVSIHVIETFNNRVILDREYKTIINNLSLREIPDHRVIELLKSLMDSLTQATLTDQERDRIERLHLNRVKNASTNLAKKSATAVLGAGLEISAAAATGGTSLAMTRGSSLGAVAEVGMAYWDYQSVIDQLQSEKDNKEWAISAKVLEKVNQINKQMLDLSWQLYTEYEVPEDWRLVSENVRELTEINRERDLEKRLRMLDKPYMRAQFARFAPYWFYVGSTAQQLFLEGGDSAHRERALQAYDQYEKTRSPILKKDEMYASVSLGRAQLLDPERQKKQIADHLEIIEKDPPGNAMTISAMALLYAQIDEHQKAREWAQHNIDRAPDDAILHQQVMATVLADSGNRKALEKLIARLVSESSAQTFEILDMVGPLDATQVANSLRPRLVAVQPSIEERTMRDDNVLLEIPVELEADMKELALIPGSPTYDPQTGLRTVNGEVLSPDEVSHSDSGKRATFRFEGIFDADDWNEAGISHVLFRLQEAGRTIDLLYEVVEQPEQDPAYRFELDQVAIESVQFRETETGFVAAAPLLKKEFDASLAGLAYSLSQRYGLESGEGPIDLSMIATTAEKKGDMRSLRELVRRMKDDSGTSHLDIVAVAQAQKSPRTTLQALPFKDLQLSHEENLLGSTYSLGSSALAYVGAGEYGEGREDLVLLLPKQWLGDEASVSTTLAIGEGEVEGSEPSLDEESGTHHIGFGSAYHAQQWKDDGVKSATIRFEGNEPSLVLYYTVTTPDDASEPALALETVEMGATRFSP